MSTSQPVDISENYRAAWAEYGRLRKLSFLDWLPGLAAIWLLILAIMRFLKFRRYGEVCSE
jgi:hypothetical protein